MNTIIANVLLKLVLALVLGGVIGGLLGFQALGVGVAAIAYAYWILRQQISFEVWLDTQAPDGRFDVGGLWAHLGDMISQRLRELEVRQYSSQAEADFFKDSFQALRSAVIVLDGDDRVIWCNASSKQKLGIDFERDENELLVNLLRAPEFIEYLERGEFSKPLKLASPIDQHSHLELHATRFRNNQTLLFWRDISDIVQLERMRQDFIANVSHELRTPLTVITGYLDTLRGSATSMPPIWLEIMEKMLAQSQRMDNMVNDLIWLSRLETVPADQDLVDVDINALLTSIVTDGKASAPNKTIELFFSSSTVGELDTTSPTVERYRLTGVYEELVSAFGNLIQNAIKYTQDDGEITVRCYLANQEFIVAVQDNGIGIDGVHIPRLTERFYRADPSRSSSTGGTGLGLAIVKHILVRHGGRLQVSSELGVGSRFSCVFPAERLCIEADSQ